MNNIKSEKKISPEIKQNNKDSKINQNIIIEKEGKNFMQKEKKQIEKKKQLYNDEKGNILENKIIDEDEIILKDQRVIQLMKEQEEILKRMKNQRYSEIENEDLNFVLKKKEDELNKLKKEFSKYNKQGILDKNEKIISVVFSSVELGFEYSLVCKNTDLLYVVFETELKKEKDGLDYYTDYIFNANDEILKAELSMENNGIRDGDIIYIIQKYN